MKILQMKIIKIQNVYQKTALVNVNLKKTMTKTINYQYQHLDSNTNSQIILISTPPSIHLPLS